MAEKMATRQAYGKALVEIGKDNPNLVVMDADLSKSTMTAEFSKAYPERFFNMGIAEQNLYAAACGPLYNPTRFGLLSSMFLKFSTVPTYALLGSRPLGSTYLTGLLKQYA